jgi:hypothetical protein
MRNATLPLALVTLASAAAAQTRERCGFPDRDERPGAKLLLPPSDCGYFATTIQPQYDPGAILDVPVVVHVIQSTGGAGYLSPATIQAQIDVLNEDFQALPGSAGAPGSDAAIRFHLATVDPLGNPTSGITYSTNDAWFQDSGSYWNTLAWDTNRYMNVYTNDPGGLFGYVPDWPQGGIVGQKLDRIVIWWEAFGKQPTAGWPLNLGRTLTHETGHYFGIEHPFYQGCGSAAACGTTGDLICDTNPQSTETLGCPGTKSSCGSPDAIHNYMDYSDDPCLWEFTPNQVNRMRCTIEHWRPNLPTVHPLAIASVTPASVPALTVGTAEGVTVSGAGFTLASVVDVDGVVVPHTLVDAHTLTLDPPVPAALGPATLTVSEGTASASGGLTFVANDPPAIQAGDGDAPALVFSATGLDLVCAGTPGEAFVILASPSAAPTVTPFFQVDIGAGFTSLLLVGTVTLGPAGTSALHVPLALAPLTTFYVEGLAVDALLTLPLADTNTQQVDFVL